MMSGEPILTDMMSNALEKRLKQPLNRCRFTLRSALQGILAASLTVALLAMFCAMPARATAATGPIAILLSDSEQAYNKPVTSFAEEVERQIVVFNLHGGIEKDPQLKNNLLAHKPVMIFALGAKAAFVAKLWTKNQQDIPVIFAMVLNWQHYNLLDQGNMTGIASEIAPGTQFVNMTMYSPEVKRVGVIYSDHSSRFMAEAHRAADLLGLELVSMPIERSKEFQRTFKKISPKIDAYWVLSDPVVYTLKNMAWLEDRCIKERLLCVGQSANIVKLGVTLAVNLDPENIGSQAASMAKNVLEGRQKPQDIGVMDPLGTQILVNLKTAGRIGLEINQSALDMATQVFD